MFGLILEADVVVCDMTIHNANVFYELGIRHALRKKRSVRIRGAPVADEVPFDNLTDRYLAYDVDKPDAALQQLTDTLTATLASERTDSPIFKMLPALPEVDPASVQILPQDLGEEVERAKAAKRERMAASPFSGGRNELWPKVGEGVNRGRRHIVGVFEPPLLHRRSDTPCPTITLSN